jgi:hypothetical protein
MSSRPLGNSGAFLFTAMKLLICILALLSGCVRAPDHLFVYGTPASTPVRGIPVWSDVGFTNPEKADIADAISLWNTALNGYVVLSVASTEFDMDMVELNVALSSDGFLFLQVSSSNPLVHNDPSNAKTLGWANLIGGNWIYLVSDRIPNGSVKSIAAHELGHLLGSVHGGTYLMAPYYDPGTDYDCVDAWTARQVRAAQHLPDFSISYCDK